MLAIVVHQESARVFASQHSGGRQTNFRVREGRRLIKHQAVRRIEQRPDRRPPPPLPVLVPRLSRVERDPTPPPTPRFDMPLDPSGTGPSYWPRAAGRSSSLQADGSKSRCFN